MNKILALSICLVFFKISSFAQISDISEDSLKTLLCHKWGFKAIIMGGQEMTNFNETVTYELSRDYSFQRVTEKKTENGSWKFDADKKMVILKFKKTTLCIFNLTNGEFTITACEGLDPAKNQLGVATIFKTIEQ